MMARERGTFAWPTPNQTRINLASEALLSVAERPGGCSSRVQYRLPEPLAVREELGSRRSCKRNETRLT